MQSTCASGWMCSPCLLRVCDASWLPVCTRYESDYAHRSLWEQMSQLLERQWKVQRRNVGFIGPRIGQVCVCVWLCVCVCVCVCVAVAWLWLYVRVFVCVCATADVAGDGRMHAWYRPSSWVSCWEWSSSSWVWTTTS